MNKIGSIIVGIICIIVAVNVIKSCVFDARVEAGVKERDTQVELSISGPTHDEWDDGRVVNSVAISFYNSGMLEVSRISLEAHLYTASGEHLGFITYEYGVNNGNNILDPSEKTKSYSKTLTSYDGKKAVRVEIKNFKVNGYNKKWPK